MLPRRLLTTWTLCSTAYLLGGSLAMVALASEASEPAPENTTIKGAIPVRFTLDKPGYVTLAVEDKAGVRVANLLNETRLPAGTHTVIWDGYDIGFRRERGHYGDIIRKRIEPGDYTVRGLVHDGLKMIYEMSVYSPGTPAWHTLDTSGNWLSDHHPPDDILWLPKGGGGHPTARFLACANVGECGRPLIWLDGDGKKLAGVAFGWNGAKALARDAGPKALPQYQAYLLTIGAGHGGSFILSGMKDDGFEQLLTIAPTTGKQAFDGWESTSALAVRDGLAVLSDNVDQRLLLIDLAGRKITAELPLEQPRGLAFTAAGRLLALSGTQLLSFAVERPEGTAPKLTDRKTLLSGLDDPRRVLVAADGTLYLSQHGKSHQVRVFAADGKPLRTIGRAGGPQLGAYDELRMQMPQGLALDDRGRLWVTEHDTMPKRISVWKADGSLDRAYYGGPRYGGGGMLDPLDRRRWYYAEGAGELEFQLDWKTGGSRLAYVNYRQGLSAGDPLLGWGSWNGPQCAFYHEGRQYMSHGAGLWLMDKNHLLWPVATCAGGDAVLREDGNMGWPVKDKDALIADLVKRIGSRNFHGTLLLWTDQNFDHFVQPEEVQIAGLGEEAFKSPDGGGGQRFYSNYATAQADLSFAMAYGLVMPCLGIDANGVPQYDLGKRTLLANMSDHRGHVANLAGDWYFNTTWSWERDLGPLEGWKDGRRLWHVNRFARQLPAFPGQLLECGAPIGPAVVPPTGEAGPLFACNGNKGVVYLITADGLIVQTLGQDCRTAPWWRMAGLARGAELPAVSFEDEHFCPSMRLSEGKVYLDAGKEHCSILRVDGWESVKRKVFGTVRVKPEQVTGLPPLFVERELRQMRKQATAWLAEQPPTVDGRLDDWTIPSQGWLRLDERASASLMISGDRLYAAWRTDDAKLLANAGGNDWRYLFKTGGSLDLQLGSDCGGGASNGRAAPAAGDLRLLVTQVKGRTRAVLYRPVVEGTTKEQRVKFDSPVGEVWFDRVEDVSEQVQLAQDGGTYELSVPLAILGLKPSVRALLADLGVIRGNGAQNTQRVYWNNLDCGIVSDIPSEVRLRPGSWGYLGFAALPKAGKAQAASGAPAEATAHGWSVAAYDGAWDRLPDFATLKPVKSGAVDQPTPGWSGKAEDFGLRHEGWLEVPAEGLYGFALGSDDGGRLVLDGQTVLEHDGLHATERHEQWLTLAAGRHSIRLDYFQRGGGAGLVLEWSPLGGEWLAIPPTTMWRKP